MANEAVIVELLGDEGDVIDLTVAAAGTIPKGTLMRLGDGRSGAASLAGALLPPIFAGVTTHEKASGATNVSVYTHGIFDLYAHGVAITAGDRVVLSGANYISGSGAVFNSNQVGRALETTVAGTEEQIEVMINI